MNLSVPIIAIVIIKDENEAKRKVKREVPLKKCSIFAIY